MIDATPVGEKYYHAHCALPERCNGRMACLRACPTEAIRVREGRVLLSDALCVDCGTCLSVCPSGAIVPIVDPLSEVRNSHYKVVVPSPVLYTQFGAHVHPYLVDLALRQLGFDEVVDTSRLSAQLGRAYPKLLAEYKGPLPLVSNHCPSVVRLIQVKYPGLVEHIAPFDVPRELTAREVRRTLPASRGIAASELAIFYVAPCLAKVVSARQPAEKARSSFDGVIAVAEVYAHLRPIVQELLKSFDERQVPEDFSFDGGWALFGGMTRAIGTGRWLAVSGVDHVRKILDDIENSRLRSVDFVEACAHMQGCVGGPLNVENPYVARANAIKLKSEYRKRVHVDDEEVEAKLRAGYFDLQDRIRPRPPTHFDTDVATSIKRLRERDRVFRKLRQIDCGCCGAPTCLAFAEDFTRGEAKLTDCVFLGRHAGTEE